MSTKEEKIRRLKEDSMEEDSEGSFMEPKKKRGRPKGSKNAQKAVPLAGDGNTLPPPALGTPEDIAKLKEYLTPVFGENGLCSTLGEKLAEDKAARLGPTEAEILIDAAANCVNQYLPGMLGAHAHLIVFSLTFGQWGLRVYLLRQAKIEELRMKHAKPAVEVQNTQGDEARPH